MRRLTEPASAARRPATDRQGRQPLSRARILVAAVQLVDEEGLESLTMRRLGQRLGVQGMSLYNHIPSKAALLWGVMETVLAEMKPVYSGDPDWRDRLRAGMRAFRAVGLAHPRVFALNTRPWPGAAAQRSSEDLQTLSDAGFTQSQANYAFHALVSYVVGFVAWETAAILRDPAELAEGLRLAPADLAPVHKELHEKVAWVARTQDDAFELGLEAMLNGLEDLLERPAAAK